MQHKVKTNNRISSFLGEKMHKSAECFFTLDNQHCNQMEPKIAKKKIYVFNFEKQSLKKKKNVF